jgi:hypothetical protein
MQPKAYKMFMPVNYGKSGLCLLLSFQARRRALLLSLAAIQNFETFISLWRLNFDMQQNLGPYKYLTDIRVNTIFT